MSDDPPRDSRPEDLADFDRRLREKRDSKENQGFIGSKLSKRQGSALGLAFRVAVELVSALAVGLGIGWLLDEWLDTRPWLMLVFIVLGFAAGVLNVYRMASGYGYAVGYTKPGVEDDKKDEG